MLSSSIFSFDTLTGLPRPTRSLWLTLAICLAFRCVLFIGADALDSIPAPSMMKRYEFLERVHVRAAKSTPKILLMGNSLVRYGLLEEQLAKAAGLEPNEVLNLGVGGAGPWEAMLFLRRNPDLAKNVQLVVYNVGRQQIERSHAVKHMDRFYRYSTLGERLAADGWDNKVRLLLDYAWPCIAERRQLTTWVVGLAGKGEEDFGFNKLPFRPAWEGNFMAAWEDRREKFARKPPASNFVHDFAISPQYEQILRDFVSYWRDRGVKLLLVKTPIRRIWLDAVLEHPQAREHLLSFEDQIKAMTGGDVTYCPWYTANQCGVDDPGDFLDDSHLTPEGARKLTTALLEALEERGLLPLPGELPGEPRQGISPILAQKPPALR